MADLHPFEAWRPPADKVRDISCPPYDIINTDEARALAKGHPESFLHIVRPEIDLPEGTAFNEDIVYQKGADNLREFQQKGLLQKDGGKALYIYQLSWQGNTQTGIFGCVSVEDYDNEIILKHELTRPSKEDDRTRHILSQQAHAEPVIMTFKDDENIQSLISEFINSNEPLFNFKASDGVTHRLWKMKETVPLVKHFAGLDRLYIADGHHRCKAASRAAHIEREKQAGNTPEAEYNYFPAVMFPMSEMNILPYNRLIHEVPNDFISRLVDKFGAGNTESDNPPPKGTVNFYDGDRWRAINLPTSEQASAVEKLDVYRLQHLILEPMLGIDDPRRDDNISFVGGIRGIRELENRVDDGRAEVAISMHPTAIGELVEVSDQHLLMPPKSTWFEPKLRSGLLVHTF